MARALERRFEAAGMQVAQVETTAQVRRNVEQQFNIMVAFLLVMAGLLAVVGGLGLAGTMSINVLERLREIGVMRAVGALFLEAPLSFRFSTLGALLWLLIVVVLAAVASFFPAWNASRLSVRDVLPTNEPEVNEPEREREREGYP